MKKCKIAAAGLFLFLLCLLPCSRAAAADEIYVAGMPDAWPMEYYDTKTNLYKGVIPDILIKAGEAAGVTIHYIQPSSEDNRYELAKNRQVDLICTEGLTESMLEQAGLTEGMTLVVYSRQGQEYKVSLAYTKSMPDEIRIKLETALGKIENYEIHGLYIDYIQAVQQNSMWTEEDKLVYLFSFGVLTILILAVSICFIVKKVKMEQYADRDEVTGRENFAVWKRNANRRIVDGNREHYAIIFLDGGLDMIRHIYGYKETDSALRLFSDVCAAWIRPDAEGFSRFNGYYFVFYVQCQGEQKLKERIDSLCRHLKQAFEENKKRYFLELNAGIYQLKSIDKDLMQAIQLSEVASEYAKAHYLNCVFYNELVEKETISDYALEHEAIHGLIHREFTIYFQPIIDRKDRNIYGAEALARWQNPRRGLLSPSEFLEVMKKKQLIGKMNLDIYRQGCRFLQKQQEQGRILHMMFNFTAENIGDEHFPKLVEDTAVQFGVNPENIILQLNQPSEMGESELFMAAVKKLRTAGFHVWMSALELDTVFFQLLDCGVNGIKLGNQLVREADQDNGRQVLKSVIDLCHKLGLQVLCVGAENKEQVTVLDQLECEFVSGMYFYYPVTGEVFDTLLV